MSDLNDPRVLFAAERTLLAWIRTNVALMGFGFVIERFGLLVQISGRDEIKAMQRHISFVVGIIFILFASLLSFYSIVQHKRILKSLAPGEIPEGYYLCMGISTSLITGI